MPEEMLLEYLGARASTFDSGVSRQQLESKIHESKDKPILLREMIPKQISHWTMNQYLTPVRPWEDDYWLLVRTLLKRVSNKDLRRFYPHGKEHNRERS
jgi:hypothetical protein